MERSNLFYRVITAVILVPLAILAIFKAPVHLVFILLLVIVTFAAFEFASIVKISGVEKLFLILANVVTLYICSFYSQQLFLYLPLLFIFVSVFVLFNHGYINYVEKVGAHLFCNFYLPFLLSFSFRLTSLENGRIWLFYLLLVNWFTDTLAYFVGTKFGKHKLTAISPKKSVEGLIGGVMGGVLASVVVKLFLLKSSGWLYLVLLGVSGSLLGQIGDLVESGIKRSRGVKDSGTIIPGHGGFLDRFDSLIFTGILFYIFAKAGLL